MDAPTVVRIPGQTLVKMLRLGYNLSPALFHLKAAHLAAQLGDETRFMSTPPEDVAVLLKAARGTRTIVEIGTGPAWTAALLALTEPLARVVTYDPVIRPFRDRYLALVGDARTRIEFRQERGDAGPAGITDVDLLFIDSSHDRQDTVNEFRAWEAAVRRGGLVAFHDYIGWQGVEEAVRELGLAGRVEGMSLFVWRKP